MLISPQQRPRSVPTILFHVHLLASFARTNNIVIYFCNLYTCQNISSFALNTTLDILNNHRSIMDSFLTPHQLKDVLIEWYSLDPTLVSGQDTRPPESMAVVNLECDDSSILTIPSLSESHRQFNKNMQRQDCLSKIVRRYSPTQIPRKFCDDCVKLLDKELREIFPELPEVTNLSDDIFRTKVSIPLDRFPVPRFANLTVYSP